MRKLNSTLLKSVRFLVMDVDGVLTDGRMIYDSQGNELKCFDVQDGMGIAMWKRAGYGCAIITAKKTSIVVRRAKEYRVDALYQNYARKSDALEKLIKEYNIPLCAIGYIGDDLLDIPVLSRVGFAVAPANACVDVKRIAHYITKNHGGRGAVRETIEYILNAQGKWNSLVKGLFLIGVKHVVP